MDNIVNDMELNELDNAISSDALSEDVQSPEIPPSLEGRRLNRTFTSKKAGTSWTVPVDEVEGFKLLAPTDIEERVGLELNKIRYALPPSEAYGFIKKFPDAISLDYDLATPVDKTPKWKKEPELKKEDYNIPDAGLALSPAIINQFAGRNTEITTPSGSTINFVDPELGISITQTDGKKRAFNPAIDLNDIPVTHRANVSRYLTFHEQNQQQQKLREKAYYEKLVQSPEATIEDKQRYAQIVGVEYMQATQGDAFSNYQQKYSELEASLNYYKSKGVFNIPKKDQETLINVIKRKDATEGRTVYESPSRIEASYLTNKGRIRNMLPELKEITNSLEEKVKALSEELDKEINKKPLNKDGTYVSTPEIKEKRRELQTVENSLLNISRSVANINHFINKPTEEGLRAFGAEFKNIDWMNFLTLGFGEGARNLPLLAAVKKQQKGQELTEEEGMMVRLYNLDRLIQSSTKSTISGGLASGFVESVTYMLSIAATSGAGGLARKSTTTLLNKSLDIALKGMIKSNVLTSAIGLTAQASVQGVLMGGTYSRAIENQIENPDANFLYNVMREGARSGINAVIEVHTVPFLNSIMRATPKQLGALYANSKRTTRFGKFDDVVNMQLKPTTELRFLDDWKGELVEDYAAQGVEIAVFRDENWNDMFSIDNFVQTLGVIALMQIGGKGLVKVIQSADVLDARNSYTRNASKLPLGFKTQIIEAINQKTPEQQNEAFAKIPIEQVTNRDDRRSILNFLQSYAEYEVKKGILKGQQEVELVENSIQETLAYAQQVANKDGNVVVISDKETGEKYLSKAHNKETGMHIAIPYKADGEVKALHENSVDVIEEIEELDFVHSVVQIRQEELAALQMQEDAVREMEEVEALANEINNTEQTYEVGDKVSVDGREGTITGQNDGRGNHMVTFETEDGMGESAVISSSKFNVEAEAEVAPETTEHTETQTEKQSENADIPRLKDGTPDFDAMDSETLATQMEKTTGSKEKARGFINSQLKNQQETLKRHEKKKAKNLNEEIKLDQEREAIKDNIKRLSGALIGLQEKTEARPKREAFKQKVVADSIAAIKERYNGSPKVYGRKKRMTIANGEQVSGRWVLIESGTATASHDAFTFEQSPGFPVTADGKTVNDRDYKNDKAAQEMVMLRGDKYDDRGFNSTVTVSEDGIVVSGNDRTMSRERAAKQGTDKVYKELLREDIDSYGISKEQFDTFTNPQLVFELDGEVEYTTEFFKKFNAPETKQQNTTEKAVAVNKTISPDLVTKIAEIIDGFETIGDFYANDKAVANVLTLLQQGKVLQANEIASLVRSDGTGLSGQGKELIETIMTGSVLSEKGIRGLDKEGMRNVRTKIIKSIIPLMKIANLKNYNLTAELGEAINIVDKANEKGMSVDNYINSGTLFEKKAYNSASVFFAHILQNGKEAELKQVLSSYYDLAVIEESRQQDMFREKPLTKIEIIDHLISKADETIRETIRKARNAVEQNESSNAFFARDDADGSSSVAGDVTQSTGTTEATGDKGQSVQQGSSIAPEAETKAETSKRTAEVIGETLGLKPKRVIEVENRLAELGEKTKKKTRTKVVASVMDAVVQMKKDGVPENIIEAMKNANGKVEAVTTSKGIYFISSNISDAKRATEVWFHEQAGHYGIKLVMPTAAHRKAFFTDIYNLIGEDAIRKELGQGYEKVTKPETLGEEYFGRVCEKVSQQATLSELEQGVWNTFLSKIAEFIKAFAGVDVLTKDKIEAVAKASIQNIISTREGTDVDARQKSAEIDSKAENVDANPTQAQKEAGNYQKAKVSIQGLEVTIENEKGTIRSGVDENGAEWTIEMNNHYGYFNQTKGKDGEQIDVFIGNNPKSEKVFVIDQLNTETQEFDESKVMIGFNTVEEAKNDYLANYEMSWTGMGAVTEVDIDSFKTWLNDGKRQSKPFSQYKEFKEDTPMFSIAPETNVSPIGFYSTVENALNVIQQNKGTKDQFRAMLLKNGAKQAEMDWMGFDDQFPDALKKVSKEKQLDIIQSTNPMLDDYHVGIRKLEDIKTFDQVVDDSESFVYGDFSKEDAQKAIKEGSVTVYSSTPIKNGAFVSTSENEAKDYAGNGKVYSQKVILSDVAWINGDQGQMAKVDNTITKADIQNWIDENRIEVEEVVKGGKEEYTMRHIKDAKIDYNGAGSWIVSFNNELDDVGFPLSQADDKEEAFDKALELVNYDSAKKRNKQPKFSQYVLPGGENYKELLLTMPNPADKLNARRKEIEAIGSKATEEQKKEWVDIMNKIKPDNRDIDGNVKYFGSPNFKSSHYDEPNILAHIRFNERTVNGERVLFIEEFQSDWAQAGREKGFKNNSPIEATLEKENVWDVGGVKVLYFEKGKNGKNYRTVSKNNEQVWFSTLEEARAEAEATSKGSYRDRYAGLVPDMPFKKTDQWVNLATRRMMRYAAENGFDRIAWTTGEQQSDRYDLSKHVDWINAEKTKAGDYKIEIGHKDGAPMDTEYIKEENLEENLGKELAAKIIQDGGGMYKGLDLKVGGKGMKAFYDGIVPSAMSKLGKPFGAKVEQVDVVTEEQSGLVQSLPVTDSMRESVSEGIPLFSIAPEGSIEEKLNRLTPQQRVLAKQNIMAIDAEIKSNLSALQTAQKELAQKRKSIDERIQSETQTDMFAQQEKTKDDYMLAIADIFAPDLSQERRLQVLQPLKAEIDALSTKQSELQQQRLDKVNEAISNAQAQLEMDFGEPNMTYLNNQVQEKGVFDLTADAEQLDMFTSYKEGTYDGEKLDVTYMERMLSKQKGMTFMGERLTGRAKIKSANDVAFLFKNLESASSENAFAVLHKDNGDYKVLYLSTGGTTSAIIDLKAVVSAMDGYDSVTLVHNHPSGNLDASQADMSIHRKLELTMLGIGKKTNKSIIINLDSGKYTIFTGTEINSAKKKDVKGKIKDVDVYSFDRQKLYVPSVEKPLLSNPQKTAEYLSKIKRGSSPKIITLVVDNKLAVNRVVMFDESITQEELVSNLLTEVSKHGEHVILASNKKLDKELIGQNLGKIGSNVLDIVTIKQDSEILKSEEEAMFSIKPTDKFQAIKQEYYTGLVTRLKKAFPNINVSTDVAEMQKELDKAAKKGINTLDLRTPTGELYGFVSNGKIFLDGTKMNANAPIHEFGHIWADVAEKQYPEVYNHGISLIEGTEYYDQVKNSASYKDLTEEQMQNEALVTAIGDMGEKIVNKEQKNQFIAWVKDFFNYVRMRLGINKMEDLTNNDLSKMNLTDFVKRVNMDLLAGVPISSLTSQELARTGQTANHGTIDETPMFSIAPKDLESARIIPRYTKDWVREIMQDRLLSVKKIQDYVLSKGGILNNATDTKAAVERYTSRVNGRMSVFQIKFLNPLIDYVASIERKYKLDSGTISDYLLAKASLARHTEGVDAISEEADSDWNMETVQGIIKDFEDTVHELETEELWKRVDAVNDFSMRALKDAGILTKEEYDKIKGKWNYYVPLRGWDLPNEIEKQIQLFTEMDKQGVARSGDTTYSQALRKAKGRKSKAYDPISTMANIAHSSLITAEKNVAELHMLNFIRANKELAEEFAVVKRTWVVRDPNTGSETEVMEKPSQDLFDAGLVSQKVNKNTETFYKHVPEDSKKQKQIEVYENGVKFVIEFKQSGIAEAIRGTNMLRNAFIDNTIGHVTRFLSKNLTGLNPDFITVNFVRDFGYAVLATAVNKDSKISNMDWIREYRDSAKAIKAFMWNEKIDESDPNQKEFVDFMNYGGATGYVNMQKLERIKKQIDRDIARLSKRESGRVKAGRAVKMPFAQASRVIGYFGDMSEISTRFAVYKAHIKAGSTVNEAADAAKNITVNFNRKGRFAGVMGGLFAFYNASIQGGNNVVTLAYNNKIRMAQMATSLMAFGALWNVAMSSIMGGNPDDDGAYLNINEFTRYNNLVIPTGEKTYMKIPLPHVFRSFFAMGQIGAEMVAGHKDPLGGVLGSLDAILDGLSPINLDFGSVQSDYTGSTFFRSFLPSAIQPLYDLHANRNFYGQKILQESIYDQNTPKSQLGRKSVAPAFSAISDVLNTQTGGDKYKAGVIDVNPSALEYLFESYTGGRGRFWLNIVKLGQATYDENIILETRNIPIGNRFVGVNRGANWNNELKELKTEILKDNDLLRKYNNDENYKKEYKALVDKYGGDIVYSKATRKSPSKPSLKAYEILDQHKKEVGRIYDELNKTDNQAVKEQFYEKIRMKSKGTVKELRKYNLK